MSNTRELFCQNLSVLCYANGFTMWHYTTQEQSVSENFFNNACEMLSTGDIIVCHWNVGHSETSTKTSLLSVKTVDKEKGTVVTVQLIYVNWEAALCMDNLPVSLYAWKRLV